MASKRCVRRRKERQANRLSRQAGFHAVRCCKKKQPFSSFEQADAEMHSLMAAPHYDGEALTVYLCPITEDHFHFGHVSRHLRVNHDV